MMRALLRIGMAVAVGDTEMTAVATSPLKSRTLMRQASAAPGLLVLEPATFIGLSTGPSW